MTPTHTNTFTGEIRQKHITAVRAADIQVGDFVVAFNRYGDCWSEVAGPISADSDFVLVYDYGAADEAVQTRMAWMPDIWSVHHKDDPWDHNEVRVVVTADGVYGSSKRKSQPPVPDQFRYQGTYWLKPQAGWVYNGQIVRPKKPKDFAAHLTAIGLTLADTRTVPWDRVDELQKKIEVYVRRWKPVLSRVANEHYNKTLRIAPWSAGIASETTLAVRVLDSVIPPAEQNRR